VCAQNQAHWTKTLEQLKLKMVQATFDRWLKNTQVVAVEGDIYTVGVASDYAKEWLEHRLNGVVTETLARTVGNPIEVKYIVVSPQRQPEQVPPAEHEQIPPPDIQSACEPSGPSSSLLSVVRLTSSYAAGGYTPVLHYVDRFWSAYWQCIKRRDAAAIWTSLRDDAWQDPEQDWTPTCTLNASYLARRNQPGRQAVSGYRRHGRYYPSSLDILRLTGFAVTRTETERRGHASRKVSVLRHVPLLTPWQASFLTPGDQEKHEAFLTKPLYIDLDDWQAITVRSLMPAFLTTCDTPPFQDDGRDLADAITYWPALAEHAYRSDLVSDR
jgi:hypothetical protein